MLYVCSQANYRETIACTKIKAAQRARVLQLWKTSTNQLQVLWQESSQSTLLTAALYNEIIFLRLQNFNKRFYKTLPSNAEPGNRTVMSYATAHFGSSVLTQEL